MNHLVAKKDPNDLYEIHGAISEFEVSFVMLGQSTRGRQASRTKRIPMCRVYLYFGYKIEFFFPLFFVLWTYKNVSIHFT